MLEVVVGFTRLSKICCDNESEGGNEDVVAKIIFNKILEIFMYFL